jgi:diadenosine tetraphosphate (Ap4A) HIT family hydrolase
MQKCLSCLSISGEKRISPGEVIYEGSYWVVEHAYPSSLLGWIVVVLKRHTDKLHELSREEWNELGDINFKVIKLLHRLLETEKEYSCCYAEGDGFKHIHFHIIPKSIDYIPENKGAKAFNYLKVTERESINKERIIEFCSKLKNEMN